MKNLLLALLCTAPLMVGYGGTETTAPVSVPESIAPVETVYLTSMGCALTDCTDPTHFHSCPAGCTDPVHYHSCPVGCADPAHPYCSPCVEGTAEACPVEFCFSMGCALTDCTDPTHFHSCPAGCTDPAHYHNCPVGCQNTAHPHSGGHHRVSGGHHGRRHH